MDYKKIVRANRCGRWELVWFNKSHFEITRPEFDLANLAS